MQVQYRFMAARCDDEAQSELHTEQKHFHFSRTFLKASDKKKKKKLCAVVLDHVSM